MRHRSICGLELAALIFCFWAHGLFGARTAISQTDASGGDIGFRLVGTAVSDNPGQSLAVMEDRSTGEQGAYSEGDRPGGVLIKKILFGKVVFDTGMGDAILSVGSGRLSGSRPPAPETGPLTKDSVEAALPDYAHLMREIRVRSQFQGGRPAGFVIYKIEPGSIFERMGLRDGDVIVKVNGSAITSSQPVVEFYDALKAGGTVSLEIRREETTRDLMFEID